MIAIPAIDLYANEVVRLTKGDFENVSYYRTTPVEQAKVFEDAGFSLIHVIDLIGSRDGKFASLESLSRIKEETNLQVEFGGGIRDLKTAKEAIDSGADYIIIGSLAVKNKPEFELIVNELNPDKIISAADVLDEKIQISGWTEETGITLHEHINYCQGLGVIKFLCTDISKDGMLSGTNKQLYKKLSREFGGIKLFASGGIKDIEDVRSLSGINPYGVIVGKAIYEGKIDIKELAEFAK